MTVDFNGKNHSDFYQSDFYFWYSGNVEDDLIFEYGEGADAFYGCGATLMGEMFYFGGSGSQKRQVWIVYINRIWNIFSDE